MRKCGKGAMDRREKGKNEIKDMAGREIEKAMEDRRRRTKDGEKRDVTNYCKY